MVYMVKFPARGVADTRSGQEGGRSSLSLDEVSRDAGTSCPQVAADDKILWEAADSGGRGFESWVAFRKLKVLQ
jgi:hypothetical protein